MFSLNGIKISSITLKHVININQLGRQSEMVSRIDIKDL